MNSPLGGTRPRWRRSQRARRGGEVLLACLCGAVAVLVVPYFVPMRPALSYSYLVGFNNRACIMALVLFFGVFAYWNGPIVEMPKTDPKEDRLGVRPLLVGLGLSATISGLIWWYGRQYGTVLEAPYFLDRLQHLQAGERIYRDFEFAYGAGLLYVPLTLAKVPGMSLLDGYMLAVLLASVAGVALQWWVIRWLVPRTRRAEFIFYLLLAPCLLCLPLFGEQYTALRFWIGVALAVVVYRSLFAGGRAALAWVVLPMAIGCLLLLFPEQGGALLAATAAFALLQGESTRDTGHILLATAATAAGMFLVARTGVFTMATANARGGYALPVTLAPALLPIAGLMLVAFCGGLETVRRREGPSAEVLLLLLTICLLPSAFGHFDRVHLLSCMPGLLVGWALLAHTERTWRWSVGGYAFLFLLPMLLYAGHTGLKMERRAVAVRRGELPAGEAEAGLPRIYSPFGELAQQRGSRLSFVPVSGHYFGVENVITPEQASQAAAEIDRQSEVVVPDAYQCTWRVKRREVLLSTTGLWSRRPVRESPILEPVCAVLERDFVADGVSPGPGLRLLRHR